MTSLLTNEAFQALGAPQLVYVREVTAREILADTPVEAVKGFEIDPQSTLYAVHRADGERLAVLSDRDSAFAAALANELAPVSVH
jgi:hypothetical protein